MRDAFVDAYTGVDALRRGFEYYRAMKTNATAEPFRMMILDAA
jgi:hypothetical protein